MSEKRRKLFPYGISNMQRMATGNYVFVDKTHFVEQLENEDSSFLVFLRPRRFGKSLFVSLLEYYYDVSYKEKFATIFSEYYIGKNPTKSANSYRVLTFDFSGIDTRTNESTYEGFLTAIKSQVSAFCETINMQSEVKKVLLAQNMPEAVIRDLFFHYPNTEPPIYLLIDEYDHFTNEILMRSMTDFKNSVTKNGFVRKFYETIKTATRMGVVERIFITGVSPMTLDGLTSGFNITTNLTLSPKYHDMMGFSEQVVRDLLGLVLKDKSREEQVTETMRVFYNGYKFHKNCGRLYNSDMVLYFLKHFADENKYPEEILDENIAPDYGKLMAIFERLNWTDNSAVLEEVLRNEEITAPLLRQFNFMSDDWGISEFVSFLFYLGNLTIKGENEVGELTFKIPNKVIEELYWQYYAVVLKRKNDLPLTRDKVMPSVRALAMGNHEPFFALVQEALKHLSNRDFQGFDEKYVKMLVIAYAVQSEIFFVQTERETSAGQYIDLEFLAQPKNREKRHFQYVFEFKYLKKEKAHLAEEAQKEAEMQLRSYLATDENLKNIPKLRAFTVLVVKDELVLKELLP